MMFFTHEVLRVKNSAKGVVRRAKGVEHWIYKTLNIER